MTEELAAGISGRCYEPPPVGSRVVTSASFRGGIPPFEGLEMNNV